MRRSDYPRGTRLSRFQAPCDVEPGDVIERVGPRIGTCYDLVIDVNVARKWVHVAADPLPEHIEAVTAILDATTIWHVEGGYYRKIEMHP